jgi:hypothetical protein
MKILRKGDDFRKVHEITVEDVLTIRNLINQGWDYCSKQVYKDFYKSEKVQEKIEKQEAKQEAKKDKQSKK